MSVILIIRNFTSYQILYSELSLLAMHAMGIILTLQSGYIIVIKFKIYFINIYFIW